MTFLHRPAHRLARLRGRLTGVALTLLATTLVGSCEKPLATDSGTNEVAQFTVFPRTMTLRTGQTADVMAVALASSGDTVAVAVTWNAASGAIMDTSSNGGRHYGKYKAGTDTGTVKLIATAHPGNMSDTATVAVTLSPVSAVSVSPPSATVSVGQTAQLTATPKDASGTPLSGRAVTWSSSDTTIARVSGSGLVTAIATGSATITATSEGQSGTSSIAVTAVPVASVAVTPASAGVQVGQTAQFTATLKDANGSTLSGRVVTWASSNTGVASVSSGGRATPKANPPRPASRSTAVTSVSRASKCATLTGTGSMPTVGRRVPPATTMSTWCGTTSTTSATSAPETWAGSWAWTPTPTTSSSS